MTDSPTLSAKIVLTKSRLLILAVESVQDVSAWRTWRTLRILRALVNCSSLFALDTLTENAYFRCGVVLRYDFPDLFDITTRCVLNNRGYSTPLRLLKVEKGNTALSQIVRL